MTPKSNILYREIKATVEDKVLV